MSVNPRGLMLPVNDVNHGAYTEDWFWSVRIPSLRFPVVVASGRNNAAIWMGVQNKDKRGAMARV